MSDRTSTATPGGVPGIFVDLAREIASVKRRVADLEKTAESPTKGFIWLPGGGGSELWIKSTVTGSQEKVAGPL